MASSLDLNVTQGSDYTISVVAVDDFGVVINLTDYTVGSLVKNRYGDSSSLFSFNASVTNATAGEITLSLTPSETEALPVGKFIYGVELKKGTTIAFKILKGYVNVIPEINK